MLYPQNGDRIVAIDSVTSFHPIRIVWGSSRMGQKNIFGAGAHWRHLANTLERSAHSGDVDLRQFTFTAC